MVIKYFSCLNLKSKKNFCIFYSSIQLVKNESKLSNIKIKKKNEASNFFKKKNFNLNSVKQNFGISNSSVLDICKKFGLNNRVQIFKIKLKTHLKIVKIINKLTFKKSLKNKIINIRKFAIEKLKNYKDIRYFLN